MKTYLVTYYFTNGEVHAVRYKSTLDNVEMAIMSIFDEPAEKYSNAEDTYCFERYTNVNDEIEFINLNQVCRFTIDEIEGDEE